MTKNIKFDCFDWKETYEMAERCVELGNKGYTVQIVNDTYSDSHFIAYAKEKFTATQAQKEFDMAYHTLL